MINIDARGEKKPLANFWSNIHFHPTDAIEDDWGRRILERVAKDGAAQTVRIYAMFEDAVKRGADGRLSFDFSESDARTDFLVKMGFGLLISYNFLPPCITADPSLQSSNSHGKTRYKGKMITTSLCTDYGAWEEICAAYTRHLVERYGARRVSEWYLQCYNEPDLPVYFAAEYDMERDGEKRLAEYLKLYRGFANAVQSVCPDLKAGGPALASSEDFFDGFLSAVKREGLKFDFVSFHIYGTTPPQAENGSRPIRAANTLEYHERRMAVVNRYFPSVETVVDEWGMTDRGFACADEYPLLTAREDSTFAAYYAKMITLYVERGARINKLMICLSGQHELKKEFNGFRGFFTLSGLEKPVYNAYVLAAKLKGFRIEAETDDPLVSVLATAGSDGSTASLISYAGERFESDLPEYTDAVRIMTEADRSRVRVYVIDGKHCAPFALWKKEKMADVPVGEDLARLKKEAALKCEADLTAQGNDFTVPVRLTANGVCLILTEPEAR